MTTQSIIVYRNPAEAQFWESGMAFPLIASLVAFVIIVVGVIKIFELRMGRWKVQQSVWPTWVAVAVASIGAGWIFVKLFI